MFDKNYAGYCKQGLECTNELCVTSCKGAGVKCWDGATVAPVEGVVCCDRCDVTSPFQDANCGGCVNPGGQPAGTTCFPPDLANPVTCCNGDCVVTPDLSSGTCP